MNPDLNRLQPYPFEKLAKLKAGIQPPAELDHIALSIGEPKHPTPDLISRHLLQSLDGLGVYPSTRGTEQLRQAIADWCTQRFDLPAGTLLAESHVLPVNGTREALFAIAQAVIDRTRPADVLMPNPFYQIYEGAALLAGAQPVFLNCTAENNFVPDFDQLKPADWDRCQLLYLCSPGNPSGAVIDKTTLQALIQLAQKHDFVIASDECYSEIYADEDNPPVGLLQAAADMGNQAYKQCLVFHSLSKRSNAPGLRSGFVAGDADIIARFFQYRTYHGCAMPLQNQAASIAAWRDETHVVQNRQLYREKFDAVLGILGDSLNVSRPEAGFYLWAQTPVADTEFARGLYASQNVTVLPGSFLSRPTPSGNPGSNRVRMALVAPLENCMDAAHRIREYTKIPGAIDSPA